MSLRQFGALSALVLFGVGLAYALKEVDRSVLYVLLGVTCGIVACIPTVAVLAVVTVRSWRKESEGQQAPVSQPQLPPVVVIGSPGNPFVPQPGYLPPPRAPSYQASETVEIVGDDYT